MKKIPMLLKKIGKWFFKAFIFFICLWGIMYIVHCATYSHTVEYKLDEFDDGVYGYFNVVSSSIPNQNYEMIILCVNGNIMTLKGDISIQYTTQEPKVIWTNTKLVNGDDIVVYAPIGSIKIEQNIGLK